MYALHVHSHSNIYLPFPHPACVGLLVCLAGATGIISFAYGVQVRAVPISSIVCTPIDSATVCTKTRALPSASFAHVTWQAQQQNCRSCDVLRW